MNRSLKESLIGGRNVPVGNQHRRGTSLTGGGLPRDTDENLDLFSRNRRSLSVASTDESEGKLGRLSLGSAKLARSGMDDLLSSNEGGKNDYDWLLTPPGTPLFPSSDGNQSQPLSAAPRNSAMSRSVSTTKASRLSVSQTENNHSSRPVRSSSVTRPAISSTYTNKSTNILNTSSASVSCYIRPSTPTNRSSRPSTPSARPVSSRPSTPSKVRPTSSSSSMDRGRPSQNSRPSTPSSRPQIPANLATPVPRSASRPSTPTRRNSAPSFTPPTMSSSSVARSLPNGRTVATLSRPSSPSPRVRAPPQPMVLSDFSLDAPPNLRTTLPDRPLSAGRSRPGASNSTKGNSETSTPVNVPRRQPSPVVSRGRLMEQPTRERSLANGPRVNGMESHKVSLLSESPMRKPMRTSVPAAESGGFGRSISKNSLNMAIRHMDIKGGAGSIRSHSGPSLFPQSVRSANLKGGRASSAPSSVNGNLPISSNNGSYISKSPENGHKDDYFRPSAKLTESDIYESSRYDTILLKEDLLNTNWLHSFDDKSDQGPIFENGLDALPEPFDPL